MTLFVSEPYLYLLHSLVPLSLSLFSHFNFLSYKKKELEKDSIINSEKNYQDGHFRYKADFYGYKTEEIEVKQESDEIIIIAHHIGKNLDEYIDRSVEIRLKIPEKILKETIKCNVNEQGILKITGSDKLHEPLRRKISIYRHDRPVIHKIHYIPISFI